jgi:UDP-glucose 4-epimerase
MVRFFISGGAGFIGSHVAQTIVERALGEVVIFDDLSSGHEENIESIKKSVEFIKGDVRDLAKVEKACVGSDFVIHMAALVSAFDSYNRPRETNEINVIGTYNVLEAAHRCSAKRVVLASSAAIYGPDSELPNKESMLPKPVSPYAISKFCNEYHAKLFSKYMGLETVSLRLFNVYGLRQDPSSEYSGVISRLVDRIQSGQKPIVYGDGSQTRDFIFVKDVADAAILAATSDRCKRGEVFNLGTGKEVSLLMLVAALSEAFQKKIEVEFKDWRKDDIRKSVADVSKIKEVLGFQADSDFNKRIKEFVESIS